MAMTVGLTYDQDYADHPGLAEVQQAIERLGHRVLHIGGLRSLVAKFAATDQIPWDLCVQSRWWL